MPRQKDFFDEEWIEIGAEPEPGERRVPRPRPLVAEPVLVDDDLVVVNKPAGQPVVAERGLPPSVVEQLARRLGTTVSTFRVTDKLDSSVSGLFALARSRAAENHLTRLAVGRRLLRTYLAIVRGAPEESQGRIDVPIGRDRQFPDRARIGGPNAKAASTEWTVRDRFAVGFALLEVRPFGERLHQVRLHLQAAGMPLAVDPEYGGNASLLLSSFKADYHASRRHEERPLIARVSLHAAVLEFEHPADGRPLRFEAAPPKDFRATLNQLDKHGRCSLKE